MSEPSEILESLQKLASPRVRDKKCRVVITSGPTRTYLDGVRFITNKSSGRMGHALAEAAVAQGADVCLITGPVEAEFRQLSKGRVIEVETGEQMFAAAEAEFPRADIFVGAAAVSDFTFSATSGKLPRKGTTVLRFEPSRDILGTLAKQKRADQLMVGFAAEWGADQRPRVLQKLKEKNIDLS